jgi:C4-dicarboxylate transporter DctQ subunit
MEMFNCTAATVFCGALVWYGWQIVATARLIEERSASDLQFPMWLYYAALPVGSALMLIRYVIRLIGLVRSSAADVVRARHHGSYDLLDTE